MCVGIDVGHMSAQEFRANVEVNAQKIEGTNKEVFETLKESMRRSSRMPHSVIMSVLNVQYILR